MSRSIIYFGILSLALLVLTGCATTKTIEPVYVNKVVTVSCIVDDLPKEPSLDIEDDATLAEQIQAITVYALELKQYSNQLKAILEGCR